MVKCLSWYPCRLADLNVEWFPYAELKYHVNKCQQVRRLTSTFGPGRHVFLTLQVHAPSPPVLAMNVSPMFTTQPLCSIPFFLLLFRLSPTWRIFFMTSPVRRTYIRYFSQYIFFRTHNTNYYCNDLKLLLEVKSQVRELHFAVAQALLRTEIPNS